MAKKKQITTFKKTATKKTKKEKKDLSSLASDLSTKKKKPAKKSPKKKKRDLSPEASAKGDIVAEQEAKDKKQAAAQHHLVITESNDERAKWYVVHTYSGHEQKIAQTLVQRVQTMNLADKVLEILIPTQDKIHIKSGKKTSVKEHIFPGYMLIKLVLTDESWLCVRTTQGITGFVGVGNKPTSLPPDEVESIQKFMQQAAPKFKSSFTVGEAVKITDGPFSDFLGQVDTIDEARGKVTVLVSIFGRETPVELDFLQIAKA